MSHTTFDATAYCSHALSIEDLTKVAVDDIDHPHVSKFSTYGHATQEACTESLNRKRFAEDWGNANIVTVFVNTFVHVKEMR